MIQETKPKIVDMFWYDLKLHDKFSKWNTKFGKIYTFWKIHIYSTMIHTKHVIYWGNYMYF
jgi:hypothetical protein